MLKKPKPSRQTSFLMPTLNEQCDPRHALRKLGARIPWSDFEEAFGEYYSEEGRPAKPVRLMVGLLLLKQMYDQSDDAHALPEVLDQAEAITDIRARAAIVDRATGAENLLIALRSWCQEELPEDNREQKAR